MKRDRYKLFSAARLGPLTLPNRLVRSATWDPAVVGRGEVVEEVLDSTGRTGNYTARPSAGRPGGSGVSMAKFSSERAREFYAQTYDAAVPDWPGEIDFYRELAAKESRGRPVLEVACGTGRVAIRLARDGSAVVGLDVSPAMLSVAREKSVGMGNVRWVQGDMRCFELGETFALAIIPGHSFQNILTAADQVATLESIRRHLVPGGILVVHLDHVGVGWLGELTGDEGGVFQPAGSFTHPKTGQQIGASQAWWYEPATQTATSQQVWEAVDAAGAVTDRWESGPLHFHCVFRFEMEHLLQRAGFSIEAVYGDFLRHELRNDSSEMVWVAQAR